MTTQNARITAMHQYNPIYRFMCDHSGVMVHANKKAWEAYNTGKQFTPCSTSQNSSYYVTMKLSLNPLSPKHDAGVEMGSCNTAVSFIVTVTHVMHRYRDFAYIERCFCTWRVPRSETAVFSMSRGNIINAMWPCQLRSAFQAQHIGHMHASCNTCCGTVASALPQADASKQCGSAWHPLLPG